MAKTILCVDDSPSMQQMVKLTLTGAGYQVVQAGDGVEGLAKAREAAANLVITDLNMPRMNGMGLIKELRTLPAYKGVPILFLTQALNAVMLLPLLAMIVHLARDASLMGELRIGKVSACGAWATTALIAVTVVALAVVSVLPGR